MTISFVSAQNVPNIVRRPGSARTRWGNLQRSPDPIAGLKGAYMPTSKESGGGEEWEDGVDGSGKRRGGKGRWGASPNF